MSKYQIDQNKFIEVQVYVAFEDNIADILSVEDYDKLKSIEATPVPKKDIKEETEAIDETYTPLHKFELDKYKLEIIKFIPATYELDGRISSEASIYTPNGGIATDATRLRDLKIRYLLKEWTLDIPLKFVTLNGIKQLHSSTMQEIGSVAPMIVYGILVEYDRMQYGMIN